MFTSILGDQ